MVACLVISNLVRLLAICQVDSYIVRKLVA